MNPLKPVKKTDMQFPVMPAIGHPECCCSRCKKHITAQDYRFSIINNEGGGYQYCPTCYENEIVPVIFP